MSNNPLLVPWATPFGVPPFDLIRPEHFAPALERGMAEHLAEIAAITGDPAVADFANTIEALERAGGMLERVANVFSNLVSSLGSEALQAIERDFAPKFAQHGSRVSFDAALFARIEAVHARRSELGLSAEALRLLERRHLGFVRAGAALEGDAKLRMAAISERLAVLHTEFGQNVLHDEKAWHLALGEGDLDGLPGFVVEGARQAAAERGVEGFAITLARSSIEPFLTFSRRRDLRQVAHAAWVARGEHAGPHDNRALIPEILALRAERSRLLGYANYADFRLADTMAASVANVARLTDEVWAAARPRAEAEAERLLAVARGDGINDRIEK